MHATHNLTLGSSTFRDITNSKTDQKCNAYTNSYPHVTQVKTGLTGITGHTCSDRFYKRKSKGSYKVRKLTTYNQMMQTKYHDIDIQYRI